MIVIIPSAREVKLEYLRPLIDAGARFVVVDDSTGRIHIDHPQFAVYTWGDQQRMLGDLTGAIPRGTGACRDFGFFIAWREAGDDEVIVALDDDCRVTDAEFATRATLALATGCRQLATETGRHFNVLDLYRNVPAGLFPRGFPYQARMAYQPFSFEGEAQGAPLFHLGLWRGVFDVNAIDKPCGPAFVHERAELQHESVVVPRGTLISACSMNMIFRRAVIPALYQLPMRIPIMGSWVIDRYGDIWGGFILKMLLDRRGDLVSVGAPMIDHLKEGDVQRNLLQEHLAHLVNDEMIALLTESVDGVSAGAYLDMTEALVEEVAAHYRRCSPVLRAYLTALLPAWRAWVQALRRRSV